MAGQFVVAMKLQGDASGLKSAADQGSQAIDGLSRTARDAGAALDTYSAQLDKTAASGQKAVQAANDAAATERSLRSSIDNMLGIGASSRSYQQAAADVAAYGQSLDELRARYNPVFAASKQYEAELTDLNAALKLGAIDAQEHDAALADLNGRYTLATTASAAFEAATGRSTKALSLNRIQMLEATHITRELATMLAIGVSPMQAFGMEAGRIATFFQSGDKGTVGTLKSIGSGVKSFVNDLVGAVGLVPVVGIASAAFVGLGAAAVAAFGDTGRAAATSEDVLKEYNALIAEIGKTSDATAERIKAMVSAPLSPSTILADMKQTETDIRSNIEGQIKKAQEDIKSFGSDVNLRTFNENPYVNVLAGWSTEGTSTAIVAAKQKLDDLGKSLAAGTISGHDLLQRLNDLANADTFPPSLNDTLNKLREIAKQIDTDQTKLKAFGTIGKTDRPTRANQEHDATRAGDLAGKLHQQARDFANSPTQSALRQAQESLKEANLPQYQQQLAAINAQIDQQIRLNPQDAATWNEVRAAQIAALDARTTVVPIREANEQIDAQVRLLAAQAATLGDGSVASQKAAFAQQLLNKYIAEGAPITAELTAKIAKATEKEGDFLTESLKVDRAKQTFDDIHQAGSQAIDDLTSKFAEGSASISDIVQSMTSDIEKQFLQMSFANPLKNALYNTNLPTLSDAGGVGGFFSILLGGKGGVSSQLGATPVNAMWVRSADGVSGTGTGNILGNFLKGYGKGDVQSSALPAIGDMGAAVKSIESSGNYAAVGPLLASGDRAYGAYGVMGNNIAPWTKQTLGYSLSPSEFLASPSAQDAVFSKIFGSYAAKNGADNAASWWFTGKNAAAGADRTDLLGTSGSAYVEKFNTALQSMTSTTDTAAKGLDVFGNGLGSFGQNLSKWFPAAPGGGSATNSGSGNIFSSLFSGADNFFTFGGSGQAFAASFTPGLYDKGGHTGYGDPSSIAGFVHGQEYVFDAVSTRAIGPSNLEAMRKSALRGYSDGGYVSSERPWLNGSAANGNGGASPVVQIYDQRSGDSPPVETTTTTDARGNKKVAVLIRKTVQDETLTSGRTTNRGLKSSFGLSPTVVKR